MGHCLESALAEQVAESVIEVATSTVCLHPIRAVWKVETGYWKKFCEKVPLNWQGKKNYTLKTDVI